MKESFGNNLGLDFIEQQVMDSLVNAWDNFLTLPRSADDTEDFRRGIHSLQRILAMRVIRREHPEGWS